MSGLEGLGIAASILQVADIGLRLAKGIYEYADSVASADSRLTSIGNHIDLTSEVKQVADVFSSSVSEQIVSQKALKLGRDAAGECEEVFRELTREVDKLKGRKRQFYKFPFKEDKLLLMVSRLEKLKSTLICLMNILLLGKAIKEDKDDPELRKQIGQLILEKEAVTKKYHDLLRTSKKVHPSSPAGYPPPPPKPMPSQVLAVEYLWTPTGSSGSLTSSSFSRFPNASSAGTRQPPRGTGIVRPLYQQNYNSRSSSGGLASNSSGDTATAQLEECAVSLEDLLGRIDMILGRLRRQSRNHLNESEFDALAKSYLPLYRTMSNNFWQQLSRPKQTSSPRHPERFHPAVAYQQYKPYSPSPPRPFGQPYPGYDNFDSYYPTPMGNPTPIFNPTPQGGIQIRLSREPLSTPRPPHPFAKIPDTRPHYYQTVSASTGVGFGSNPSTGPLPPLMMAPEPDLSITSSTPAPSRTSIRYANDIVDELLREWTTLYTDPPEV